MKLDLDSVQKMLKLGEDLCLQVNGVYLYGVLVDGNCFIVCMVVVVEQKFVEGLLGYFFGDLILQLLCEVKDVIDIMLLVNGQLCEDVVLLEEVVKVKVLIVVVLFGSLYEIGGCMVICILKWVMWLVNVLVGVWLLFNLDDGVDVNGNVCFELMCVDVVGMLQLVKGLKIILVCELCDYYWIFNDNCWDYDFICCFENKEICIVDVGSSVVVFDFLVEWGEYWVDVFDLFIGLISCYLFCVGWSWGDDNCGLDVCLDKVKLGLDKIGYKVGDILEVMVILLYVGKGILMVEIDCMLYVQDIDVKLGLIFKILVIVDWECYDVYIIVLVFRGGSVLSKIILVCVVGVVYVLMDCKGCIVVVGLVVFKQMWLEQDLLVIVSVLQLVGKIVYVIVLVVDVGIFNIICFLVFDVGVYFFVQCCFGIDVYDIYSWVIESFDGGSGKLKFGGDMVLQVLLQVKCLIVCVQIVDLFFGLVQFDVKGNVCICLKVLDFNGILCVLVLVYSDDQYGKCDVEIIVCVLILVEVSMFCVLVLGDCSIVILDVQNFIGKLGQFNVKVEIEGLLNLGEGSCSVQLNVDVKIMLSFLLLVCEGYSVVKVRVWVDGNGFKVDCCYDLLVCVVWLQVLCLQVCMFDLLVVVSFDNSLIDGLMVELVNVCLLVSLLLLILFVSVLQGVLNYLYGCVEQIISKGYVVLILDQVMLLMFGVDGLDVKICCECMEGVFGCLVLMQVVNGNFLMWGDDGYVNLWLILYIIEFLFDVKDVGFVVFDNVLQKVFNWFSEDLLFGGNQFYGQDDCEKLKFVNQVYLGYVLVWVNCVLFGILCMLYDNECSKVVGGLLLVYLGVVLLLQGDVKCGQVVLVVVFVKFSSECLLYFGDYGSVICDDVLMIVLIYENKLVKLVWDVCVVDFGCGLDVCCNVGWMWLSMQEQVVIVCFGKVFVVNQKVLVVGELVIGGNIEVIGECKLFGCNFSVSELVSGVCFILQGQLLMFVSIDVVGILCSVLVLDNSVLGIEWSYFGIDGKLWLLCLLKEGEVLIVCVIVIVDIMMFDVLLIDLLLVGLEIENFNLGDVKQWVDVVVDGIIISDWGEVVDIKYEEFCDDCYVVVLKFLCGSKVNVFYLVCVVILGIYLVLLLLVEDMYWLQLCGVGCSSLIMIMVVQL